MLAKILEKGFLWNVQQYKIFGNEVLIGVVRSLSVYETHHRNQGIENLMVSRVHRKSPSSVKFMRYGTLSR